MVEDPLFLEPDLKTLRLTRPVFDAERLERFVAYQRRFVEAAGESAVNRLARAHQLALEESQLDPRDLARITPVVADFAGKRWTLAQLTARRDALEAKRAAGEKLSARDATLLQKLPKEIARASETQALAQRYGQELIDALLAREPELVSLHERVMAAHRAG